MLLSLACCSVNCSGQNKTYGFRGIQITPARAHSVSQQHTENENVEYTRQADPSFTLLRFVSFVPLQFAVVQASILYVVNVVAYWALWAVVRAYCEQLHCTYSTAAGQQIGRRQTYLHSRLMGRKSTYCIGSLSPPSCSCI